MRTCQSSGGMPDHGAGHGVLAFFYAGDEGAGGRRSVVEFRSAGEVCADAGRDHSDAAFTVKYKELAEDPRFGRAAGVAAEDAGARGFVQGIRGTEGVSQRRAGEQGLLGYERDQERHHEYSAESDRNCG